jgi:hypothetical protein
MVIEIWVNRVLREIMAVGLSGVVTVEVDEGITVCDLMDEMEITVAKVRKITVNGIDGDGQYVLHDGDRIELL